MAGSGSESESGGVARVRVFATAAVVALLGAYVILVTSVRPGIDADTTTSSSRRREPLTGLEAFTFAAADVIVGAGVEQQVTRKSDKLANRAQTEGQPRTRDAETGRALQRAIGPRIAARGARERDAVHGGEPLTPAHNALNEFRELTCRSGASG